jgi:hypothetical protein
MVKRRKAGHEATATDQPWLRLWPIKCRLAGLGLMLKAAGYDPDLGHEDAFEGIGALIEELADEVGAIHDAIDDQRLKGRGQK